MAQGDVFDLGSLLGGGDQQGGGMLGNLQSLFGGQALNPAAAAATGQANPPLGFMDTVGANRNAIIGLGLGMLAGTPFNRYGPAMQGFQTGASADASTVARAQQLGLEKQRLDYQKQQDTIANALRQKQFEFSTMSDASRAARDLGLDPSTPAGRQFMETYYRNKSGDQPTWGIVSYDAFKNPIMGWINPAKGSATAVSIPGQTTTAGPVGTPAAAPAASAYDFGAGRNVPYAGAGGEASTAGPTTPIATAPAATAVPNAIGAGGAGTGSGIFIAGPNGTQIEIPKNADPAIFRQNVSRALADAAVGKQTEQQSKDAQYAARMAIASKSLDQLEQQGLNLQGNVLAKAPLFGNYLQTPQYQEYQAAKSQFLTALLRKESGAAIAQHEFDRYDRELFPQPGEKPNVVEEKSNLRAAALANMARAAGPSYQAPDITTRKTPIGGGGQTAPTAPNARTGGAQLPSPATPTEAMKLGRGKRFILPDGTIGRVP